MASVPQAGRSLCARRLQSLEGRNTCFIGAVWQWLVRLGGPSGRSLFAQEGP